MQSPLPSLETPAPPPESTSYARRRKRGQLLVGRLKKLSSSFPEFRDYLAESLELIQEQIDRNPESDRQLVLSAIHLGAWTIDDLKHETKLSRGELQKILDAEHAKKIILKKESQETDKLGGRPKILWLPAPNLEPEALGGLRTSFPRTTRTAMNMPNRLHRS